MINTYSSLISIDNLFQAWDEFKKGKRKKRDVQVFERNLEDNLFNLHQKLTKKTYRHGQYTEFYVNDPKRRHIHKAEVADRVVHHLLYKYLYEIFDKTFIFDSYSCRLEKGTHRAVKRLEKLTIIVSKNYSQDCWALKLDIRKFFESVDHGVLKRLIAKKVKDKNILWLVNKVIDSYPSSEVESDSTSREVMSPWSPSLRSRVNSAVGSDSSSPQGRTIKATAKGIPLGNLSSQIFANIYLNELDQFVKHKLKIEYYLRYADDFIILNYSLNTLFQCIKTLTQYVESNLLLNIHPNKITTRKLAWGIDFCGYIVLPHYAQIKTETKRRIFRKVLKQHTSYQSLQSYLGHFSHAKSYKISQELKNHFYLKSRALLFDSSPLFC